MANRNEFVEDDADLNQRRSPGGTQQQQATPPHGPAATASTASTGFIFLNRLDILLEEIR
jgi:hypothetical protein